MKTIELNNGLIATVDDGDFDLVNKYKWRAEKHGTGHRATRTNSWTINGEWKKKSASLHRYILKCEKGQEVDHIDGNGLNNQRSNLRICTRQQNCWNKPLRSDSSTGMIGVTKQPKCHDRWMARIIIEGKRKSLGNFGSKSEAGFAYNFMASILHEGYARLNLL